MPKKRRDIAVSLSFLDVMACGFGAVTLLFLILRHTSAVVELPDLRLTAEINLLEQDIQQADDQRTELRNSIEELEMQLVEAQGLSRQVVTQLQEKELGIQSDPEWIALLRRQVEELERMTANMEEVEFGDNVREFIGEGNRQYLTGLVLGGERVLILVDGSASMLADTVVNAVRRRNMDDEQIRASPKWVWTVRTVEWLLAQLPPSSRFQIYVFNTGAEPALPGTEGEWLDAADSAQMEEVVDALKAFTPGDGTSLVHAFKAVQGFRDKPDNLFLLTDGLPTQGENPPRKALVSGDDRRDFFLDSIKELPAAIPVNTILFPMEGDPEAAAMFWQLAMTTRGAFVAPSRDWP